MKYIVSFISLVQLSLALEVNTFDASLLRNVDTKELAKKDEARAMAVDVLRMHYRAHILDVLNRSENNIIPIKFRNPITESAFSVIFNEIACCFFNIHVKNRVKYNQFDNKILEVPGTDYKNYTNANWSYVFLVNVIDRFMSESKAIIEHVDYTYEDNIKEQRLSGNIKSIFDSTFKELSMRYKSHENKILCAMNNVSKYFKYLELSRYLHELRKVRENYLFRNEDRKSKLLSIEKYTLKNMAEQQKQPVYEIKSAYLSLVSVLSGIGKECIDGKYCRYELKDKHQTKYYSEYNYKEEKTCMVRTIGFGKFNSLLKEEWNIPDVIRCAAFFDDIYTEYKAGAGKVQTLLTSNINPDETILKSNRNIDITNMNRKGTIEEKLAQELKRHMEILITSLSRERDELYNLRLIAYQRNDNTLQTNAVLKYTEILLNGLDYMIMMNNILPYDKLNNSVGKTLGEILYTITMSEVFGIVKWYTIEHNQKYKTKRFKEIEKYNWTMVKQGIAADPHGFDLKLGYVERTYADCDIFDFLSTGNILYSTKNARKRYTDCDKEIMLHKQDKTTRKKMKKWIKNNIEDDDD